MKLLTFGCTALAFAAALATPHAAAELEAGKWLPAACSDAGYAGRAAFRCRTSYFYESGTDDGSITLTVWANPGINARLRMFVQQSQSEVANVPKDPILLKVDGRLVQKVEGKAVLDQRTSNGIFSAELAVTEALLKAIATGKTLSIEHTGADGNPRDYQLALNSEIAGIVDHTRAKYRTYHTKKGATKSAQVVAGDAELLELWGPLGEAADRSRFWVNEDGAGKGLLEFEWISPEKELKARFVRCNQAGTCREHTWMVRPNFSAIVADKPAKVLDWYNENGKVVFRFTGVRAGKGKSVDKEFYTDTFDPILEEDMEFGFETLTPALFSSTADGCCINVNFTNYSPSSTSEAKRLFDQQAARIEQERAEKARAAAARAQALRDEEASKPATVNVDRGPDPDEGSEQSFIGALADAYQQTRQSGGRSTTPLPQTPARTASSGPASSNQAALPSAKRQLSFTLYSAMRPGKGAKSNPRCFSNVVTIPAPPGYGWVEHSHRVTPQVYAQIEKTYYPEFIRKCNAAADGVRNLGTYGTVNPTINQWDADAPQRAFAQAGRAPEDIIVQLGGR